MKILAYRDSMYPEDNEILGIWDDDQDDELLKKIIEDEIDADKRIYPGHPRRNKQKSYYYHIDYDVMYYGNQKPDVAEKIKALTVLHVCNDPLYSKEQVDRILGGEDE